MEEQFRGRAVLARSINQAFLEQVNADMEDHRILHFIRLGKHVGSKGCGVE